ncbi:ABC transporter substrate-binding protein [Yoonia sediminilitoris]|uniref:Amino acid/amide ABC transporter substrate-binding protein (HAAT family) n=1 Tax=Yoonia sediminilitoris TaxID=1286148 RepID=A0A2T6KS87_9RHOB|nr:ABC transporter substrate-binding protein [Yoonia sediminilitoris]PUB19418.1 amino acid/amide ABC transporter substrate-binding protein (HAAT family) [Yoonia sediminilitoris]RCW99586.1 amino acid/amide ABC transporter substrate-binding protein (HAAT family) [Yoonia sediminilitoris]
MRVLTRLFGTILIAFCMIMPAYALDVRATVLRVDYPSLLPISRYDLVPDDLGFAGAVLGDEDNQTTGSFLGMTFETEFVSTAPEALDAQLDSILAQGTDLLIVMADADDLLKIADRAGVDVMVINATARDTHLRDDMCRANTLHVAPSQSMMADAVVQFAMWKRWRRLFLIHGSNPADRALGDAYRRAATKFGAEIVEEREFEDTGGSRRTDTGHVLVQRQIPVFTQDAADHDVVLAADASDVFGLYLPFHLWTPRPVMGSGGLRPVTFHAAHEAWGATQFQRRFEALSGRYVQEADYQVWLALRVIGEAVIRTNSAAPDVLMNYILSEDFELAAFKGRKVNFRPWNGQLRQPILLTDSKLTVSVSPQDGYLHQRSTLDTLGLDQPESACSAFDQ